MKDLAAIVAVVFGLAVFAGAAMALVLIIMDVLRGILL